MNIRRFQMLITGLVLIMSVLAAAAYTSAQSTPPVQQPLPGEDTLILIQNTIVPIRDRVDLAQRLLGVTDIPAPPASAPPELKVGDTLAFWADNQDANFPLQIEAQLAYKTEHVYMFVETGYRVDRSGLMRSAETFETLILPKIHEVFGTEWSPGIDGDPHLYVLHATNLGNVAGYYGSASQYPREAVENSNEHEMFFVNLDAMGSVIGSEYYESVLAHEFQHMVHWYVDQNEESWINEGMSELAAMLAGYGLSGFVWDFLAVPETQLNTWPEAQEMRTLHYGAAFLFSAYFYQRYGEAATTTLVRAPANGLISVDHTLAAIGATDPTTGEPVTAVDLFGDWVVANALKDAAFGDGRYAYVYPDLAQLTRAAITGTMTPTRKPRLEEAPQWGAQYWWIKGQNSPQRLRFTFKGNQTVSLVPTEAHSGRFMWWSNRADESDVRLTRAVDLTQVGRATLNYWVWYHIEDLWDYGYVMVSTDEGHTWTPLETDRTTTENPHSNAYGPGYTGQSDGWVQESIDLTLYAGQNILVRFEYITDDAVTQPGMIIDDINIPEIDYTDDVEADSGAWQSEGWLRMDNELPQRFLVQVVQPGNIDDPVMRILGPDDLPAGEWEIMVGGEMGDALIVVSGLAPVTTESAPYSMILSPME